MTQNPLNCIAQSFDNPKVDILSKNLYHSGIRTGKLHGGLTQNKRKEAIDMFHAHKFNVLVASDVAARGLDIKNVSHIINYDIPKTSNEYIHRIGRTARAGSHGKIISLLSEKDYDNFRRVLEDRSLIVKKIDLPEFPRIPFIKQEHRSFDNRGNFGNRSNSGNRRGFHRRSFRRR